MIKGLEPLYHPDPAVQDYNLKGVQRIPAVVPENPNLKLLIGEFIYEYVEKMIGEEKAPKITGMLIDLPHDEIKGYLYDFFKLQQKVQEANEVLNSIASQEQLEQQQQ